MKLPSNLLVLKELGKGNFGKVILCRNIHLDKLEAVKIIEPDSTNPKQIEHNIFESQVLEYLKKSDFIVDIYDASFIGDDFMIKMEYLELGSLEGKKNISIKELLKISEHISYALEHAHNNHILHLDIKPGNILIKEEFSYKLSDFGLSNIKNSEGESRYKGIYNLNKPPEYLENAANPTIQTDIYMLGVTLYRLINGDVHYLRQLIKGNREELILKGKFPDRKKYLLHIPKKIKKIINKLINIDLEKRYKTIKEFRKDIIKLNLKYFWNPIRFNGNEIMSESFNNAGEQVFNLHAIYNKSGWTIDLKKHHKSSIIRVTKYCKKGLTFNELEKQLTKIFSEII
ncbi:MAG: protein kinase [Candidatus Gracilibacteria bacterium]|nr:protein kinase [Candidatus Gracilibacteria bacterium]